MKIPKRPLVEQTLGRLKDFQRISVEYVFRRLYTDPDPVDRFLLADEVGLGKTLVARGVIAKTIDHLWDTVPRIDVLYVCSNADIARQNINRLRVPLDYEEDEDGNEGYSFASRVTLLPLTAKRLEEHKVNFLAFTPGTSFDLGKRTGVARERALLFHLLRDPWSLTGIAPRHVLRAEVGSERFDQHIAAILSEDIDPVIRKRFCTEVNQDTGLQERFFDLCGEFRRADARVSAEKRWARLLLIGHLR
ncbi:MAG TPA: DEAD/DEAH box helicase, partial [Polyangia bacterium]|nr:DEAD/DEAH box helicase [Polyangia bacterium]